MILLLFVSAAAALSAYKANTGAQTKGKCIPPTLACLKAAGITLHLDDEETDVFAARLCNEKTERYLEFGAGGSTLTAAYCDVREIVSLDNAAAWQKKVGEHAIWNKTRSHVQQLHVGLGEVGSYSRPITNDSFADFIHYSHGALRYTQGTFDVILIDGRFRVASALVSMQRMRGDSALFIHDYTARSAYRVLEQVLDIEDRVGTLVQFRLPKVIDVVAVERLLRQYIHNVEK